MPIYRDYFIFIALSLFSFLIAEIIKKNKESLDISSPKPIRITIGIVGLYYAVKIFFGWRFTSWYFEAFLMLCVCFALDYFVIIKNRYPKKTNTLYYVIRISSIVSPSLAIAGAIFFVMITFGWGGSTSEYVFPLNTSYGEQWVYRNLYIYKDERNSGSFAFKKKLLFFEKDVARISGTYMNVFGRTKRNNDPITGYVNKNIQDSIIYISGGKDIDKIVKRGIEIIILKPNDIKIESFDPSGKVVKSIKVKL